MSEEENELILAQDKAQDKAQDEIVNEKISNMNEEEKKSIEILKERKRDLLGLSNSSFYSCDRKLYKERVEAIDTILNLISKQQKEIEELKHDNSVLCEIAYTGKRIQMPYTMVYTGTDNFISKDKIKEKIEEITKEYYKLFEEKRSLDFMNINGHRYNAMKLVLEELLGE